MKRAEIEANARKPYADCIARLENEIRLLRRLAITLGASELALGETRYGATQQQAEGHAGR